VDLGKLIEEIVPWLVIAAMYLPWLRKWLRKQKHSGRQANANDAKRRSVPHAETPAVALSTFLGAETGDARLVNSGKRSVLPDEGVPAVEPIEPMKTAASEPRHFSPRRRELRKALVLGEILQRKY